MNRDLKNILTFRVAPAEQEQLIALAEERHLNQSDIIREALRQYFANTPHSGLRVPQ
jgi:predicted transcriptional regulator